jgi:hypothetical protein
MSDIKSLQDMINQQADNRLKEELNKNLPDIKKGKLCD